MASHTATWKLIYLNKEACLKEYKKKMKANATNESFLFVKRKVTVESNVHYRVQNRTKLYWNYEREVIMGGKQNLNQHN